MTLRPLPLLLAALALPAAAGDPKPPAAVPPPVHPQPRSPSGNLVLGMCDGETSLELKGVKEGETLTREQALAASRDLMSAWRKKNPDARWDPAPKPQPQVLAQASPSTPDTRPRTPPQAAPPGTQPAPQPVGKQGPSAESGGKAVRREAGASEQSGHTYGAFSDRDEAIWAASVQDYVKEGHRIFHDAEAVGGTVAMSCDMCHPDAANTHPETYPKYQVQLGRVALLRDMINWCLQNPVRAKPMADDDPRLRAMEAYILAQRKGTKLEYGKH